METIGIELPATGKKLGRPKSEEFKASKRNSPVMDADTDGGELVFYELIQGGSYKYVIASESEVFDGKKREVLRYLKGYNTISVKEQIDLGYDEKMPTNFDIMFLRGQMAVNRNNPSLIEFMDRHDMNDANPRRISKRLPLFRRIDTAKKELEQLSASKDRFKAMKYAFDCSSEELFAKAWAMGIDVKRSEDRVRASFTQFAENNPDAFVKLMDNPTGDANYSIYLGLQHNIISDRNGAIYWASNPDSAPLVIIPPGADTVTHAGKWASSTEQGKTFLELLNTYLDA